MPAIQDFASFKIVMYFKDHNPPHVHVVATDFEAQVTIETLEIIAGQLAPNVRSEAFAWIAGNKDGLMVRWSAYQK
jgi:uncharacterized protein DUF4160